MKIFAYGSNLSGRRLRKRVPSATFLGRARLAGYVRRFHKRGADESAIDDSLQPYHWYLAYVIDGAREQGLPGEEMALLRNQPSIPDPVSERAARNAQTG